MQDFLVEWDFTGLPASAKLIGRCIFFLSFFNVAFLDFLSAKLSLSPLPSRTLSWVLSDEPLCTVALRLVQMFILLHFQALKQSSTELLFGGHETTASAATSLITYLGLYPHVLQKVREELKSKVGGSYYFKKSRCPLANSPISKCAAFAENCKVWVPGVVGEPGGKEFSL